MRHLLQGRRSTPRAFTDNSSFFPLGSRRAHPGSLLCLWMCGCPAGAESRSSRWCSRHHRPAAQSWNGSWSKPRRGESGIVTAGMRAVRGNLVARGSRESLSAANLRGTGTRSNQAGSRIARRGRSARSYSDSDCGQHKASNDCRAADVSALDLECVGGGLLESNLAHAIVVCILHFCMNPCINDQSRRAGSRVAVLR